MSAAELPPPSRRLAGTLAAQSRAADAKAREARQRRDKFIIDLYQSGAPLHEIAAANEISVQAVGKIVAKWRRGTGAPGRYRPREAAAAGEPGQS